MPLTPYFWGTSGFSSIFNLNIFIESFFSKAISSNGKEDISSQSVKSKIKDLINNEKVKTLSDTKLKDLLSESGEAAWNNFLF